jgi:hypothetical protein
MNTKIPCRCTVRDLKFGIPPEISMARLRGAQSPNGAGKRRLHHDRRCYQNRGFAQPTASSWSLARSYRNLCQTYGPGESTCRGSGKFWGSCVLAKFVWWVPRKTPARQLTFCDSDPAQNLRASRSVQLPEWRCLRENPTGRQRNIFDGFRQHLRWESEWWIGNGSKLKCHLETLNGTGRARRGPAISRTFATLKSTLKPQKAAETKSRNVPYQLPWKMV